MANIFFSVVIPVFNRASLIGRSIESVLAQGFTDFELLVVDDGSTDATAEIVKSYGDRVRLLQQENKGPGPARNLGLREARGRYIAFLDSDDVWFPWTLEVYADVIERHPGVSVLSGATRNFTRPDELRDVPPAPAHVQFYPDYLAAYSLNICRGSGVTVFRSEVLSEIGGFPKHALYCEDFDLLLRAGIAPGFAYIAKPILTALRRHQQSSLAEVERTYAGTIFLLEQEEARSYGGGRARKYERMMLLRNHIWAVTHHTIVHGRVAAAIGLYLRYLRDFWKQLEPSEIAFLGTTIRKGLRMAGKKIGMPLRRAPVVR